MFLLNKLLRRENYRMFSFLLLALFFYGIALTLATLDTLLLPQVQIVLWKAGHISIGAFLGYWVDKQIFRDIISPQSNPLTHLRRAIVVVGAMIAIALGM